MKLNNRRVLLKMRISQEKERKEEELQQTNEITPMSQPGGAIHALFRLL